MQARR
ncbi:hypothetical protein QTP70_017289 [Hemibagrus guttatus]